MRWLAQAAARSTRRMPAGSSTGTSSRRTSWSRRRHDPRLGLRDRASRARHAHRRRDGARLDRVHGARAGARRAVDPATDRYALACVAFELLTGRRPFARDAARRRRRRTPTRPRRSSATVAPLPPPLDAVFAARLAKHPSDRPRAPRRWSSTCARRWRTEHSNRPVPAPTRLRPRLRVVRAGARARGSRSSGPRPCSWRRLGLAWALTASAATADVAPSS